MMELSEVFTTREYGDNILIMILVTSFWLRAAHATRHWRVWSHHGHLMMVTVKMQRVRSWVLVILSFGDILKLQHGKDEMSRVDRPEICSHQH